MEITDESGNVGTWATGLAYDGDYIDLRIPQDVVETMGLPQTGTWEGPSPLDDAHWNVKVFLTSTRGSEINTVVLYSCGTYGDRMYEEHHFDFAKVGCLWEHYQEIPMPVFRVMLSIDFDATGMVQYKLRANFYIQDADEARDIDRGDSLKMIECIRW